MSKEVEARLEHIRRICKQEYPSTFQDGDEEYIYERINNPHVSMWNMDDWWVIVHVMSGLNAERNKLNPKSNERLFDDLEPITEF